MAEQRFVVKAGKPGSRHKFHVLDTETGVRSDPSHRKQDCVRAARRLNERHREQSRREPRTIEVEGKRKGTRSRRRR